MTFIRTHPKGVVIGAISLGAALLTIGCSAGEVTNPQGGIPQTGAVTSVVLSPLTDATILARGTVQLKATAYDVKQEVLTGQVLRYTSSDTSVLTVSDSGLVMSTGPVGSARVTASSGGVQSNSVTVTVLTGTAATVVKAAVDPTVVVAGRSFADSVRVRVLDAGRNPVPGVTVAFGVTKGGGRIGPALATTDLQGRAAAQFTTDSIQGVNTATASVGSLTPVTFSITTSFGFAALALTSASAVGVVGQMPDTDSRAPPNSWWVGLKCNPPALVITAGDSIANVSIVGWPWTTGVSPAAVQQFLQTPPMISSTTLGSATSLKPGQSLSLWSGPQLFYYSAPFPSGTRWPWTALFRVTYTVTSTGTVQQTDLQWQCQ